jgi:hypothetical protein
VSPGAPAADARLADRRLIAALRRLHRREPLKADLRMDAVVAEARADPAEGRPAGHRGSGTLRAWSDADLRTRLDALVTKGRVAREGRRVRLAEHQPLISDPVMRERVDRLLVGLREAGADVPRVDALAARLGIPAGVLDQLRASGDLIALGPGIDYPPDVLAELLARTDALARRGPLNVARVRDELRISRRQAEALLAWRAAGPRAAPRRRGR